MKNRSPLIAILSIAASALGLSGCSNFLTDIRIDPTRNRILPTEARIDAVIAADVADGALTAMATVDVDILWDEEVTGFTPEDIVTDNADVTAFDGAGSAYSFTLEVVAEGTVGFSIPAGSVAGSSGDTNITQTFDFVHQLSALTVSVTSSEAVLTSAASIPVRFSFSEDVTGFSAGEVNVSNGVLSGFSGSGSSYTATLTFSSDGAASVMVPRGAALDALEGVRENSPAVFSITHDGTAPRAVLTSSITSGSTAGYRTLAFTVTFSESVSAFDAADFHVTNASLSNFSGTGDTYTIQVTPLADGPVSLSVPAGAVHDAAGNVNDASDTFSYTYDSNKVSLSFDPPLINDTNEPAVNLSIEFGRAMTGFDITDLRLTNATARKFAGSGDTYTVEIHPSGDGEVTLDIAADAAVSADGNGFENVASRYTFRSDRTAPAVPVFELRKNGDGTSILSNAVSDDILKLVLITDYAGDGGSPLTLTYTTDGGDPTDSFVNPTYLSADSLYTGINIRVEDAAGNVSSGTEIVNVTIDTSVPSSPIPVVLTDPANASNVSAFAFNITSAEAGAAYDWILSSSGGGSDLSGSGIVGIGGTAALTGLDISSLGDGTLTLKARLTDAAGNRSGWGQTAVAKDTVVPDPLSVTILAADPVTSGSNDIFTFDFTGGETGLDWKYSISSSGGGPIISETGTFDAAGSVRVRDIDVSALRDGTLTVSVTQKDGAGNVSTAGTDSVVLDAKAINKVSFPDVVDLSNVSAADLGLIAEAGSTYTYTISSSGGGIPATASGTFNAGGTADFSLDLTGLNDGYLVVLVDVKDVSGNTAREFIVSQKNTAGDPDTGTADFSPETNSVTFDAGYHGYQSVPSGYVRFDTTDIIGSSHDDVMKFSALEDGETFTLDAGGGFDIIDLSGYPSYDATVYEGQFAENQGTITVNLGGGRSAAIEYRGVERIEFSANNFTGSPHAIELDSSEGSQWVYHDTWFKLQTSSGPYHPGVVDFEGSLGLNYQLDTTFKPILDMSNKNGLIIFDFQDTDNYKYVRAYARADKWTIGELVDGSDTTLATLNEIIDETAENPLQLRVTGADGRTAELWSNGTLKTSYTFSDPLNDGRFGITNNIAHTEFTIDMTPTNWSPYVKNYNQAFSQELMDEVVIDIVGDAVDFEGEALTITGVSTSTNGVLTDNGDGTLTYTPNAAFLGIDTYNVRVTDGVNLTVGTLRFDVMP